MLFLCSISFTCAELSEFWEGWAWVVCVGAHDESGVHEREGWAWVGTCL